MFTVSELIPEILICTSSGNCRTFYNQRFILYSAPASICCVSNFIIMDII